MNLLYVAAGGAIGSCARVLLAAAINRHAAPHTFAGTFVVNLIGCFAFGVVAAVADRRFPLSIPLRVFVLAGILGGFTTFSAFTYETLMLLREAHFIRAAANAVGQVVLGLIALWAGYALVRAL
jgi:CrcB protein